MEGGDVHVIGRGAVLVGMSERTTPQAVERLALRLFAADAASRIVALSMPKARAFMHLDTVMSMIDAETFTKYAGLGMLPSYTIEPGATEGELKVTDHPPEDMHRAIANALGLERHPGADAHPGRPVRRARAVGRRLQRADRDPGRGRRLRAQRHEQHVPAAQRRRGRHHRRQRARPRPRRTPVHDAVRWSGRGSRWGSACAAATARGADSTPKEWRDLLSPAASLATTYAGTEAVLVATLGG